MYPGPYFSSWVGTAQRSGSLDSGQRQSNPNTHADPHSYSYSNANPDADSSPWRWRNLCSGMEFHASLLQYLHHHL
jgi:hypothetical protein